MMYKKTILNNKLTLVTHEMKDAYSVSIGVWFKVGSRYENDPIAGISHFLEHLIFKGSKRFDCDAIKRQIEGKGGQLNGFTSEEVTCYLSKIPHKYAFHTAEILLDMSIRPQLKPSDVLKERTVIMEEIKMYNDLPQHKVQELLDRIMWSGHPLGRNIAGSLETVGNITREDISKFQHNYYCPENMVVVFAGRIDHDDCLDFISKELDTKAKKENEYKFDRFVGKQKTSQVETLVKDIEQTHLAIGFPAYSKVDPRRFAMTLLSVVLGGNMSSRLFNEVREKRGLAYAISSQSKRFVDTGAMYIHAGLDNKKVDLALEVILKELSKLKDKLVSEAELDRAKEFILGQLAMSLEDTMEHMIFLGEEVTTVDKLYDFKYLKSQMLRVCSSNIREVARDIFNKNKINISLVGPVKDFDKERCLKSVYNSIG